MARKVELYFGSPGCGKTETALERERQFMAAGIPPERIAHTAFTRKAAHEAIDRAVEKFGFDRDRFPYFRTLHSIAFRELGLRREQVMQPSHFADFGEKVGIAFAGNYDENTERVNPDGELGDFFLFTYQLARSKMISLEAAWRIVQENPTVYGPPLTQPLSFFHLDYFVRALEKYKQIHSLLDFTDFLDVCKTELDVDVFVIDEAQDNTPQQWEFARRLGARASNVIIAGDDDQAIYPWNGADPTMLLRLVGERTVLPFSHRLPRSVFELANNLVKHVKVRWPKEWRPREDAGSVNFLNDPLECDLRSGNWLLLGRTNFLCRRLVNVARQQGVVYYWNGWSNQDPTVLAVLAYENMRTGKRVPRSYASLAARYAQGILPQGVENVAWEDILWPFEGRPDWMHALHRIGVSQREYIRALKRNGESLTQVGRIKISTIHGAKGGEADNVLVLGDWSPRIENSFWADIDAELRVWYVALTRARHNLFITQPATITPLQHYLMPC